MSDSPLVTCPSESPHHFITYPYHLSMQNMHNITPLLAMSVVLWNLTVHLSGMQRRHQDHDNI
jgi:hypothetical protein